MEHLSQEELLRLADGELAVERAAHLGACAACRSAAGQLQGQLTAITAQLRAAAPAENPESHSLGWDRLQAAMRCHSEAASAHLSAEQLLLHLDDELAPDAALHLESCEVCHDELLRIQTLLFDVEHELRALIPSEPLERREAAAAALEQRLYPPKKVISFPVRWGAVYAAAATLTFAVFGGLWTAHQPVRVIEQPVAFERPAPAVAAPVAESLLPPQTREVPKVEAQPSASEVVAAAAPEVAPATAHPVAEAPAERFELAREQVLPNLERSALSPLTGPHVGPMPASGLTLGWNAPELPAARPAVIAQTPPPVEATAADPALLLAGLQAAARTGAWTMDISPEIRGDVLTFTGQVHSLEERDRLIAAVRRELAGVDVAFDLATLGRAPRLGESDSFYSLGDRPAGGMMRTALFAHYGDAARRSFQQPAPSALEAEIARFVGEIYRSQSNLVRHAHALSGLLQQFPAARLTPQAASALDSLVRFHGAGVSESEAKIYDHLSEALPRRYWNYRGDRQLALERDPAGAGKDLLADALRLDETLTTLLGSTAGSIDAGDVESSAGALLYRIRTRAKIFASGLDSAR